MVLWGNSAWIALTPTACAQAMMQERMEARRRHVLLHAARSLTLTQEALPAEDAEAPAPDTCAVENPCCLGSSDRWNLAGPKVRS